MSKRIAGYDLIRTFAIVTVFLGHILEKQTGNEIVLLISRSLSPGLTMSLLGFISAALLSAREYDAGSFLVKRFTRIYIPLIFCLIVVLIAHALLGKKVINQHMLLHAMGLTAFFELLEVKNKATIGFGLWFITVIILMYLVFPLLQKIFRHPRGRMHLVLLVGLCMALNFIMHDTGSIWNVVISFIVGVYVGVKEQMGRLTTAGMTRSLLLSAGLLAIAALATAHVLPYAVRGLLFAFYPFAFVPLLFAISRKLPRPLLAASGLFAGLSYEFYILHGYFINKGFKDFFPTSTTLLLQIVISFVVTFVLAYVISKGASRFRKVANDYLLGS